MRLATTVGFATDSHLVLDWGADLTGFRPVGVNVFDIVKYLDHQLYVDTYTVQKPGNE